MEMNIELECPNCARNVFVAIGEFLCQDDGPSTIVAVDVFDTEDNEGEVGVGVVIGWDIHPTRAQIDLFRNVWSESSHFDDGVILHDAPSSIVDKPASRQHEMN